jgi:mono/diheme cytochrome c family protein
MKSKTFFFSLFLVGISFMIISATLQQKPWVIPAKYKTMKNMVKSSTASISAGKLTYDKQCKSCHGNTGKGDGVKAKTLKTKCTDFASATVQSVTDGELYYQSIIGRDEMPNFEKKIPAESDRWNLINYIRSFKK